jgi:uncharacterized protein (TIGR02145 family)
VKVGDATWMGENLAWAAPSGSFCYGGEPASCATDGRLYIFAAAMTACPAGWHLSTDADWKALETLLGLPADQLDWDVYMVGRGTDQGAQLKVGGASGLDFPLTGYGTLTDDVVTQWDGRTAGDARTYLWTPPEGLNGVLRRRLEETSSGVFRFSNPAEGYAISVRCVQDA